ncbi:MAG TPA: hypothetical protein VMT52_09425 [Planctomycetota bacterium]|nr:hypothetical protein [Planctomycetota bacterium]
MGAIPEHEKGKLCLKFEKGKTYVFKVNMGGDASANPRSPVSASEAEKNLAGQRRREDGTPPAGDPSRGQPGSAIPSNQEINYRIQVKEVTGDEATLLVNVDGSQPTSRAATSPKTAPDFPSSEKSIGGVAFGTYTVIVDKNGHVKTGAEPSRGLTARSDGTRKSIGREDEGRNPGREDREDREDRKDREDEEVNAGGEDERDNPRHEEERGSGIGSSSDGPLDATLRTHLAIISGCGLHEKALKAGECYSKDSAKDSEKSGATASSSPIRTASSPFAALKLRYEGPTKRGSKEFARFTILADASPANPSSSRAGSANEPKPGEAARVGREAREDRSSTERGSASGKESLGEALFCMEDGILESMRFDGSKGAFASMGRLTIDRQPQDDKARLGN